MTELEKGLLENRRMREALEFIVDWKLPKVEFRGEMISYGTARGSNGERDYIKQIAATALQPVKETL